MPRRMPSWARNSSPAGTGFTVSPASFNRIVQFIEDNEASIEKSRLGMDALVNGMATFTRSEAMKKSFGPIAPRRRSNPAMAYRIPVQRITGRYYASWYIRRAGMARYRVGNDSFEAYLIENGIFQRVRRPILKLAVLSMLRYMEETHVFNHYMDSILATRRNILAANNRWMVFAGGNASGKGQFFTRDMSAGPQGALP